MRDTPSKKLFQEIISSQDKVRILSQITQDKTIIKSRVNRNVEFDTKPIHWTPPMRMEVQAPQNIKLGLQPITLQFDSKDERYFSVVDLAFDDWKLFFVFNTPIYRLQRRQYQRLKLPAKYKNRVLLMNVNKEVWNEECEIADVSLGGCSLKLSYRSIDVAVGSIVMMDMKIGDSKPFIQIGRVCYKKLEKFEGKSKVKMGIQFHSHPKSALPLQTAIQNLAVDIFSNWTQRK